jgi:hypothetical protein
VIPLPLGRNLATVSYVDSERATTALIIRRCVRFAKHGRRARYTKVRSLKHSDRAGRNHVTLKGLRAGSYRLDVTPSANDVTGATKRVRFRITP